jgi:hypothetical protein
MLKRSHIGLSIALLVCYPMSNAEATMNKCTDGRQITYTNEPCEKMGLNSAGPIKDAVTVMPLIPKTPGNTPEKSGKDGAESNSAQKDIALGHDDSSSDASKEVPANRKE